MHFACRDGQLEVGEFLVRSMKRLLKVKNQEGKTALTLAIENGHTPLVQLCREKGGLEEKGDRTRCVQELAATLVEQAVDHRKSVFKVKTEKISAYGHKLITRDMLTQERNKLAELAQERKFKQECLQRSREERARQKAELEEKRMLKEVERED